MKNYMKITGVIAVTLSMAVSVQADEKFSKEKIAQAEQKEKETTNEKHQLGSFCFYVRPYLTDEERKQIDALLNAGLERSIPVEAKKYAGSLPYSERGKKIPHAQYILGHLWFLADSYLTREEHGTVHGLIDQGLARKYQWPASVKGNQDKHPELPPLPKSEKALSKEIQAKVERETKDTLGHLWITVRPHLTDEENKTLSNVILKSFDRYIQVQSHQKVQPSPNETTKGK